MGQSSFGWRTPGDQIIKLVNPVVLLIQNVLIFIRFILTNLNLVFETGQTIEKMTRVKKNEDIKILLCLKVIRSKALRQSFHTGSHKSPLTE
ncbi:1256_t:CDS:2 [Funneliformis mosseae]|uniref:1256_t:CDS:1 n=1 Tax=Funneliformis mosseae TaxID=27381 RepID=A0A9N9CDS1_FUNMO|nr:1256_t:CDS:2 [Funneliformis mosseae]